MFKSRSKYEICDLLRKKVKKDNDTDIFFIYILLDINKEKTENSMMELMEDSQKILSWEKIIFLEFMVSTYLFEHLLV